MKNITKLFAIAVVIFGFSANSFGQVSATATATGTIIGPIAISKTIDMNFGNVFTSGASGTVVLDPASTRTSTGGVTLPPTTGTVAAASFAVTGNQGSTFGITLPTTSTTVTSSGGSTMTVTAFTGTPTPSGTLTGGSATILVGATLNVGASQAAGTYVSGTGFAVTVAYN